jgi:prevent-host-death family protein
MAVGGNRCSNAPGDIEFAFWSRCDYFVAMKSVSVAELKSKLSKYLAAVKNGSEIIVTSHRHSIARIVPVKKTASDLKIIPAKQPVSSLKKIKGMNLGADLLAELLADRRRR